MSHTLGRPPTTWGGIGHVVEIPVDGEAPSLFAGGRGLTVDEHGGPGNPIIWHWCPKGGGGDDTPRWVAMTTDAHQLVAADPLHLEPSVRFACCGLHGFIRNGRWTD